MKEKIIYVTKLDMERLQGLIETAREFHTEDEPYLKELEKELNRGKVVDSIKIPKDIITMNTKVCIKDSLVFLRSLTLSSRASISL